MLRKISQRNLRTKIFKMFKKEILARKIQGKIQKRVKAFQLSLPKESSKLHSKYF